MLEELTAEHRDLEISRILEVDRSDLYDVRKELKTGNGNTSPVIKNIPNTRI